MNTISTTNKIIPIIPMSRVGSNRCKACDILLDYFDDQLCSDCKSKANFKEDIVEDYNTYTINEIV